jgi:transposase InsO family protein
MEIIKMVEKSNIGVKPTLEKIGVAKSTFYDWYGRYEEHGYDGLKNKYKMPNHIWNRIPDEERNKVADMAELHPEESCRQIACRVIDENEYFVSESSVYRILREKDIIPAPVFAVQSAKDKFDNPTTRVNQMWQMDFTYFKVVLWGWYYLLTVLDDYSRFVVAWKLCMGMKASDVTETLDLAMLNTGVSEMPECKRPRVLSDNGPSFISQELNEYIDERGMLLIHGRPFHPETQGKIERYHRSMKNLILLNHYYSPLELVKTISEWVHYYNYERYHEAIDNVTPADKYFGRAENVLATRRLIKAKTMRERRLRNKLIV